jgi:pyruvate dehydrogenase E1 component alpha subunit
MQKTATFEIYFTQLLNEHGQLSTEITSLDQLPKFAQDYQELIKIYTCMKKTRLFDAKAINLQKTGKLGTYPSCLWHEAIGVAIGSSMQPKDIFCPYYRDLGTMLWRGVLMQEILAYWGGDIEGSNFQYAVNDFPICVPIASQTLHAVGAAFAVKYQQLDSVVVTTVGDGGTSKGDFYEALNLAKVWNLPIVFVIINNKFAISTPRDLQTKAATLAQKAIAAGMHGEQVDGNDILGLRARLDLAIEKSRYNYEPSVIEAITYRMNDHTTADDASRYRADLEKQQHLVTDPLVRFKIFLEQHYKFSTDDDLQIEAHCRKEIEQAVNYYFALPASRSPDVMFEHLYKKLPDSLKIQKDGLS